MTATSVSMFEYMTLQIAVRVARRGDDRADLGRIVSRTLQPTLNSPGLSIHLRNLAVSLIPVEGASELVERIERAAAELDSKKEEITPLVDGGMNPALNTDSLLRAHQARQEQMQTVMRDDRLLRIWPEIVRSLPPFCGAPFPLGVAAPQIGAILTSPPNGHYFSGIRLLNFSELELRTLPPEMRVFTGLDVMDLSRNKFDKIPPDMPQIQRSLFLEHNQIRSIEDEDVPSLFGPSTIGLSYNLLQTLPDTFQQLKSLTSLNLRGNRIETIPPPLFALTALVQLDLAENQIREVPEEMGRLTQLEALFLRSNQLTDAGLPLAFGSMTGLRTLDLSRNSLTWPAPRIPGFAIMG